MRTWQLAAALWCFVFFALGVTGSSMPRAGDADLMCTAADALRSQGQLSVRAGVRVDVVASKDGKAYVKYPLLTVLQCVPAGALRSLLSGLAPNSRALDAFAWGLVPHAVSATLALGVYELALLLGGTTTTSLWLALLVAFTTPLWHYGRSLYSESLQAALTVWTIVAWMRARDATARWAFLTGGVLLGLAINAKIVLFVLPIAVLIDQLHERWDRRRVVGLFGYGLVGALPGLCAWLWYNQLRYGNMWSPGYATERDGAMAFDVPLWSGLYGLLFSSGKSVFLYAPLLIAALPGLALMLRERRRELWLIGIPIAATLYTSAKWWDWSGDMAWGPRLLAPILPLLCMPALPLLANRARAARSWLMLLAAAGFCVQLLGISLRPSQYLLHVRPALEVALGGQKVTEVRDNLLPVHFVPELSPLYAHPWLLWRYFHKERWSKSSWYPWRDLEIAAWRPHEDPTPTRLDFWLDGSTLAWTLEAVMFALLLGAAFWLLRLARQRAEP